MKIITVFYNVKADNVVPILILVLSSSEIFTTSDPTTHRPAHNLLAVSPLQHRRTLGKLISDIKKQTKMRHALMQPNVFID